MQTFAERPGALALYLRPQRGGTRTGGALQAKYAVGAPGDRYEQEADRVSEQVVRMEAPAAAAAPPAIQRLDAGSREKPRRGPCSASVPGARRRCCTARPPPRPRARMRARRCAGPKRRSTRSAAGSR